MTKTVFEIYRERLNRIEAELDRKIKEIDETIKKNNNERNYIKREASSQS